MELFKSSEFTSVQSVSKRIWESANILRKETSLSEYNVVLYLLTIYNEGELDFSVKTIMPFATGQDVVNRLKRKKGGQDLEVLKVYEYHLLSIPAPTWTSLLELFLTIDRVFLSENFTEIFEEVLSTLSNELARKHIEPMQPKELTTLMVMLADIAPKGKVFNPFAGLASFAVDLNKDISYYGQEINPSIWALAYLRLKANYRVGNVRFLKENSLENWPL